MSAIATPRRRREKARARPRPRPNVAPRPRLERSRAAGRAASFSSYVIVGIVGLLLCGIVTLQIRALQANIDAGKLDNQRRAVMTESLNLKASLAKAHPRSEVEAFARQAGMIRPDIDAYQTVRVRAR